MGFSRVFGGAFDALVQSNTGQSGATASERLYRATAFPGVPDYKPRLSLTWTNPGGSSRVYGVAARATTGQAYSFDIDSNLGTPRGRIRRLNVSTWTDVVAWTALAGVTSGALAAGVSAEIRVQNTSATGVLVSASVGGVELLSATDSSASAVFSGGSAGVYIGANCTLNDVIADDLVCYDFEDESSATPAEIADGVTLVLNGTYYTQTEWAALGISIDAASVAYGASSPVTLRDLAFFEDRVLLPGSSVVVYLDGTAIASGTLSRTESPLGGSEGHTFGVQSPRMLAAQVLIQDPDTGATSVSFNEAGASPYYAAGRDGLTVGEMIAWIIDNHTEGDGGLRDVGAAPSSGSAYVQTDIDALDAIIPKTTASGTVATSVEALLSSMPSYAWKIDPGTRLWRFVHRPTQTKTDIDLADGWVVGQFTENPEANYTRVRVTGTRSEANRVSLSLSGADLLAAWQAGLQDSWTASKQWKNRAASTVSAVNLGGASPVNFDPFIGPAFTMVAGEWNGTRVTFTSGAENGNSYNVAANTTARITFVETAWAAGGPAASDTFKIEGRGAAGGSDNGYTEVGTLFELADSDMGIQAGACITATVSTPAADGNGETSYTSKATVVPGEGGDPDALKLDIPAISMLDAAATGGDCVEGTAPTIATEIEVSAPTYSKSSPLVPTFDEPTSGFRGTAYSLDSAKWDGGGQPGLGDYGNKRILPLPVSGFTSAAEVAEYRKMAASILEITGTLAREVRVTIAGLDATWADLAFRLTISHTGGPDTGDEDADDLWPLAVEYNVLDHTTTLVLGTQANGAYNLAAIRSAAVDVTRYDLQQRQQRDLEEVYNCTQQAVDGGGDAGSPGPNPICGEQVSVPTSGGPGGGGGQTNVSVKIAEFSELFWALGPVLAAEKGGQFGNAENPGGGPRVPAHQDAEGLWWVYLKVGGWQKTAGGGTTPPTDFKSGGGGDDSPWPGLIPGGDVPGGLLGEGLGGFHGPLAGVLANLSKTIDNVTGRVIPGGTVLGAGEGATTFGPNPLFPGTPGAPPFIGEPLTGGDTVPPSIPGYLLGNKKNAEGAGQGSEPDIILPGEDQDVHPVTGLAPVGTSTRLGPTGDVQVYVYPDGTTWPVPGTDTAGIVEGFPAGGADGIALGKCGSTMGAAGHLTGDGTAADAGQADLIAPGETVGTEGAFYFPPTEANGQPDYEILPSGSTAPPSSRGEGFLLMGDTGLTSASKSDPGGPVYTTQRS